MKKLCALALCLALCGTLVVFSGPDLEGQGFVGAIKLLYQNGLSSVFGGGVMGALGAVLLVFSRQKNGESPYILVVRCASPREEEQVRALVEARVRRRGR